MTEDEPLFILETEETELETPDLGKIQADRKIRDMEAMRAVNPVVAAEILPEISNQSDEEYAATIIQAHVRGFLVRKRYVALLYEKYRQELAAQDVLQAEQLEEAEILIESYHLSTEIDEANTARRNKKRLRESQIITIQRAWRRYQERKRLCAKSSQAGNANVENSLNLNKSQAVNEMHLWSLAPRPRHLSSLSTDAESADDTSLLELRIDDTPTHDSSQPPLSSLDDVQPRLTPPVLSTQNSIPSREAPSDSCNELSTGKRPVSARANPFCASSSGSDEEMGGTLPQLDWASLERKLLDSAEEEKRRLESANAERDDVRRRLAAGFSDASNATPQHRQTTEAEDDFRRPGLSARLQSGKALQLCFMNEAVHSDGEDELLTPNSPDAQEEDEECLLISAAEVEAEDLLTRQALLQAEAQQQLAKAQVTAHEQLEREKRAQRDKPPEDIIKAEGVQGAERLQRRPAHDAASLSQLNTAQLQLLLNDMLNRIEGLNLDLVQYLMERDELHMAQDSMLVDIDDLSQRAHEIAVKSESASASSCQQSLSPR